MQKVNRQNLIFLTEYFWITGRKCIQKKKIYKAKLFYEDADRWGWRKKPVSKKEEERRMQNRNKKKIRKKTWCKNSTLTEQNLHNLLYMLDEWKVKRCFKRKCKGQNLAHRNISTQRRIQKVWDMCSFKICDKILPYQLSKTNCSCYDVVNQRYLLCI